MTCLTDLAVNLIQGGLTMPRPVPLPVRRAIYRRLQQDDDVSAIANELQLPV